VNIAIWLVARRLREPHRMKVPLFAIGAILGLIVVIVILLLAFLELMHLLR
jgi:hypothetical protein